jgi:hypothetical protein
MLASIRFVVLAALTSTGCASASGPLPAPPPPTASPATAVPAAFRACTADAGCTAVARAGCCHNGWREAVAVAQKDAYAASAACADPHPLCEMYVVLDERSVACDQAARLCVLVTPPGRDR